ncbi:MAG: HEAT repeat domain-containing protein [Sedimentisphaerales bacterium]|nr:HEAT repeat domain-containing protein [Sedimentisphaerales bacterium]
MNRRIRFVCLLITGLFWVAERPSAWGITEEEIAKIAQAAPAKPTVAPAQPRKMLVFNLCNGYKHDSIPYWDKALEIIGQKSGAYSVVLSQDLSVFQEEYLRQFDAICLNNTTKLEFTAEQRKAFWNFIHNGKGLVGVHAATDNFYSWPEMQQVMGGTFTGHPWTADGTWAFKIDDPTHPLTRAFGGKGFKISDEIYRTDPPLYERSKQRVLVSLDVGDPATASKREKPEDDDVGVTWIKEVGKGRLFYSCLGHNNHLTWTPFVLQHYLDGIQYAMGDVKADATPIAAPASSAGPLGNKASRMDRLLTQIADYNYGDSREPLTQLTDLEREVGEDKAALAALEQKFIAFLQSGATLAGKQHICRRLSIIGTEASAVVLAQMLRTPETADMARYALELIPGPAVDEALRKAVETADDSAKVGILSTLGLRGDEKSVPTLARYATNANPDVASAAVTGLGQIGNLAATQALREAKNKTSGDLQMMVLDAYLNCADKLEADGKTEEALQIYKEIFESDIPAVMRSAALRGMVFCSDTQAGRIIVDVIRKGNPEMTAVAVGLLNEIRDDAEIAAVADEVKNLPPAGQVQLITALGNRGNPAARSAVIAAMQSDNADVRIAALKALASLGNADVVPLLAKTAGTNSGAEREAARETLYSMRDPKADRAILDGIPTADAGNKVELIKAIGERNIRSAIPALFQAAADSDRNVRIESLKALRTLAEPDQLPALLDLLIKAESSVERREAERAVSTVCGRLETAKAVDALVARFDEASANGRASLIALLGQHGGPRAFATVRSGLKDNDAAVVDAAVRSLADFPDALSTTVLLDLAKNAEKATHKILALRGYIRMIGLSHVSTGERVEMCKTAMSLAERVPEKQMILSAAAKIPDKQAILFVESFVKDAQLQAEATAARTEIEQLLKTVAFINDAGRLTPANARIIGMSAKLDENSEAIVAWDDANTSLAWDVVFEKAGTYEIVLLQSCTDEPDDSFLIVLGEKQLKGSVQNTQGKFLEVSVGEIKVDTAGVYPFAIKPLEKTGREIMALQGVLLRRKTGLGSKVILTGSDFSAWQGDTGTWMICEDVRLKPEDESYLACQWGNGVFVNGDDGRTVYLFSKPQFGDCVAHVEFMVPKSSNSGVYFQGRYEIQIFDSYGVAAPKYSDCGGVYERWKDDQGYEGVSPLVNASLPPGQWQTLDVMFQTPRFDASGKKVANARFVKVELNGKVIHENVECTGPTRAAPLEDEKPFGPLVLQGDHGPMAYRNIWVAPID